MKLDRDELAAACYEVATNTMWDLRPVDVDSIQAVAAKFFEIAESHEQFVTEQGRDPNLIIRAVRYLNHVHAMPPMRSDTRWFDDMLQVIIELACPNEEASADLEMFFKDIETGIAQSRADYAHHWPTKGNTVSNDESESNDDLDRYKPPKEGAIDKAFGIGRDLVAPAADLFLPGASHAINAFTELIETPYKRRLQQWQEDIGTAVIELSESRKNIMAELQTNEEFQSVLIQATQAAIRSHHEEKRSALRNAVVNTAKGIDIDPDLKQTFVRYVDELTPTHISLLQFFYDNEAALARVDSYKSILHQFVAERNVPSLEPDEFMLLCEDLKSRLLLRVGAHVGDFDDIYSGMIIDSGTPTDLPWIRVTNIAKQLLRFINSPV